MVWPGPPTTEALWKSIQQDMATEHIMQDVQDDICCMWACIILLEKYCIHMPCSVKDQNDLILQFLQVPLVSCGALHKDWSNNSLLAKCTSHIAFFRME
jgi:hypothetical protein